MPRPLVGSITFGGSYRFLWAFPEALIVFSNLLTNTSLSHTRLARDCFACFPQRGSAFLRSKGGSRGVPLGGHSEANANMMLRAQIVSGMFETQGSIVGLPHARSLWQSAVLSNHFLCGSNETLNDVSVTLLLL